MISASSAHASIGWFFLGLLAGNSVSNNAPQGGNINTEILYTMPNAHERVKDPLAVRIICADKWFKVNPYQRPDNDYATSLSFREIFFSLIEGADQYTILRIQQAPPAGDVHDRTQSVLWFYFIHNSLVLPPITNTEPSK